MSKVLKINGLTREAFQKVYDRVLKQGLSNGACDLTNRNVCIEAAVCIATGDTPIEQFELLVAGSDKLDDSQFSDEPKCVNPALRRLKISLNDLEVYKNDTERAEMLYDIGVAQLGTAKMGKGFTNKLLKGLKELVKTINVESIDGKRATLVKQSKLKASYTLDELLADDDDELHYAIESLRDTLKETELEVPSNSYDLVDLPETIAGIDEANGQRNVLLKRFIAGVIDVLRELKSPGGGLAGCH